MHTREKNQWFISQILLDFVLCYRKNAFLRKTENKRFPNAAYPAHARKQGAAGTRAGTRAREGLIMISESGAQARRRGAAFDIFPLECYSQHTRYDPFPGRAG